jgi:hypothetical protein
MFYLGRCAALAVPDDTDGTGWSVVVPDATAPEEDVPPAGNCTHIGNCIRILYTLTMIICMKIHNENH